MPPSIVKAPFPWFGGKSLVAGEVWQRFGDVPNYVEPFAGSLAVLLGRPTAARTETINDLDCYVANFWRAIQYDRDSVAAFADWPVNECDLHARHLWLVTTGKERIARLKDDPEHYDAQVAGWWVWGLCAWIGDGWCRDLDRRRPHIATSGQGVHALGLRPEAESPAVKDLTVKQQRPHLVHNGAGIHAVQAHATERNKLEIKRPQLTGGERGVHSDAAKPAAKKPRVGSRSQFGLHGQPGPQTHLGNAGRGAHSGAAKDGGIYGGIYGWFDALEERLRYTRVCCGDWARVVTPAVTTTNGITAVFLDPPYDRRLRDRCYTHDAAGVAEAARLWAVANGDNPLLRLALCGYEEEFCGERALPAGWECLAWRTRGGYGNISKAEDGRGKANAARERIWFSPHCLRPGLFGWVEDAAPQDMRTLPPGREGGEASR